MHAVEQKSEMHPIDTILHRRSIRKFKDKFVPYDNLITIMKCAQNAPCAGNIQNTKFIIVREPSNRKALAKACNNQAWISTAPIVVAVTSEPEHQKRYYGLRGEKLYSIQNAAACTMSIIIAAEFLGLATCWVGSFDEDEVKSILAMPEHTNVHAIVPIGFADETPAAQPKRTLQTLMFFEKWWAKRKFPAYGFYSENVVKTVKGAGDAIQRLSEKLLGKKEKKE